LIAMTAGAEAPATGGSGAEGEPAVLAGGIGAVIGSDGAGRGGAVWQAASTNAASTGTSLLATRRGPGRCTAPASAACRGRFIRGF
jgi:hypothetical protein